MEKPAEIHASIRTLASLVNSHVGETEVLVASMLQATNSLALALELRDVAVKPRLEALDEEAFILELEKVRLDLAMDVQEQNFITTKLQEMVADCEDLMVGVGQFYRDSGATADADAKATNDEVRGLVEDVIDPTASVLEKSADDLENSLALFHAKANRILGKYQDGLSRLLSEKYQRELDSAINELNDFYQGYESRPPHMENET